MALDFRSVHWLASLFAITFFLKLVQAQHSVQLTNNCGFGTATLDQIPSDTLATASQVFTNTTIQAVAFLNTGLCGPNGGNCTAVDISLGSGSTNTVVVDLIPTHVFSVPVEFSFYNACDGAGVSCLTSDCVNAIRDPSEDSGEVICNADGANVLVTFCPGQFSGSTSASPTSAVSTSIITSSDIPPSSSIAASATNVTSAATSPHRLLSSTIRAIVGSVVGVCALITFGGLLLCLRRRRMQAEVSHDTIPEPYVLPPPASILNNHHITPNRPPKQGISGRSETSSRYNHYGDTEHARRRPLQGAPVEGPALDTIVERLAERFGWTAPAPSTGNHGVHDLPVYHPF